MLRNFANAFEAQNILQTLLTHTHINITKYMNNILFIYIKEIKMRNFVK